MGFYLCPRTPRVFAQLVTDLVDRNLNVVRLPVRELVTVVATREQLKLDFDDAYIDRVAEMYDLLIVSLDADFDRTPRGRLTPEAALSAYRASR